MFGFTRIIRSSLPTSASTLFKSSSQPLHFKYSAATLPKIDHRNTQL